MNFDDCGWEDCEDEDDPGVLDMYECLRCKNKIWTQYYEGMPNLNMPRCCPFCFLKFDHWIDM